MDISQNGLKIIKEAEGFSLKAYPDPVGIPTIGYGTIRYPDGRKVNMGDMISDAQAEAFLIFDCAQTVKDLSKAASAISLNQNQFDALVSFCYNLGMGAFLGSTLFRKLKTADFAGAAAEFPRWNKATVDGVRTELNGLTKRRAAERALFESGGDPGTPIIDEPSAQEKVVGAKGFRDGQTNVVVGLDGAGSLVEIVELDDDTPATFLTVLRNYPNLLSFDFARSGEAIPAGPRISISGIAQPLPKTKGAPKLDRGLLTFGMEDDEANPGNDIKEMQGRLNDLRYDAGNVDGIFGPLTDRAIRDFQTDYFGLTEADGKVGQKTWTKLWGDAKPDKPDPGTSDPGRTYLKLTKTDARDSFGLVVLTLSYFKDGMLKDSLPACSGLPSKQSFRTGPNSHEGSNEPLPEGQWLIHDIIWAGGKDNYSGPFFNSGLGPVKIPLDYVGPGRTGRGAIEIHIDWNRRTAAGTAGCLGLLDIPGYQKLVGWLREGNPRSLLVDWGLGTCPAPSTLPAV